MCNKNSCYRCRCIQTCCADAKTYTDTNWCSDRWTMDDLLSRVHGGADDGRTTLFAREDRSQRMEEAGATGAIAGFALFESGNTMVDDTKIVASKKTTTEFIAGHPNWCHRVRALGMWRMSIFRILVDLEGVLRTIRNRSSSYRVKISKPQTVYVKRAEA